MKLFALLALLGLSGLTACKQEQAPVPVDLTWVSSTVDDADATSYLHQVSIVPKLKLSFTTALDKTLAATSVKLLNFSDNLPVDANITFENGDQTMVVVPKVPLKFFTDYRLTVTTDLQSSARVPLPQAVTVKFTTLLDQKDKFPALTNEQLLDTVQRRTFKFFWEFGHPTSGLSRDADMRGDLDDCTIGGTGFGIMTLPGAIERGFITRAQGLERMNMIVNFLNTKSATFHGAFPHRVNGSNGQVILWQGPRDDGADLLETSFLMMGLLTARQYFDQSTIDETALRTSITTLYNNVEWTWFTKNGENALYWLWSPTIGWDNSFMCKGWNETLITYILAASSPTYSISKKAYDEGFASNGGMKNGSTYYNHVLPFGPSLGGFPGYTQYSFLGIDPNGLTDTYGDYFKQVRNVHLINQAYCIGNSSRFYYYSDSCWGFYGDATNFQGTIFPYVALGGLPYTPTESLKALNYFYYKLGDKLFLNYGFAGAFNFQNGVKVTKQVLSYDQLSYLVAIENYRSKLIWKLFTSNPEVKAGMKKLGFSAPYL